MPKSLLEIGVILNDLVNLLNDLLIYMYLNVVGNVLSVYILFYVVFLSREECHVLLLIIVWVLFCSFAHAQIEHCLMSLN